ncbi:unnamed protein product [Victoria cruziana]
MDVSHCRPRSFKMDRKSSLALELKETVSKKLLEFLGNYSDDVLAASAGTSNLVKQFAKNGDSHATEINSGKKSAKDADNRAIEIVEVQNNQIQPSLLQIRNVDKPKSEAVVLIPSNVATEDLPDRTYASTSLRKKCRFEYRCETIGSSLTDRSCIRDAPHESAIVGTHPIVQETGAKHIHCGGQINQQIDGAYAASCAQNLHASTEELAFDDSRLCITENADTRVSGRAAEDTSTNHLTRKRGSVWDRLGRPAEENAVTKGEEVIVGTLNTMKRQREALPKEVVDRCAVLSGNRLTKKLIGEALANKKDQVKSKTNIDVDRFQRPEQGFATKHQQHVVKKSSQYLNSSKYSVPSMEYVDKHISYEGMCRQNLKFVGDGARKVSSQSFGSQGSSVPLGKISPSFPYQKEKETLPGAEKEQKSHASDDGCYAYAEMGRPGHGSIQLEVKDVKLRLHQIEMEMQKLRSKHSENNSEIKPHQLTNSGGRSMPLHSDEDIEARTVFLTNVHFAATKEGLRYHFMKCGSVVKVIILTDAVTSQPNGSAYIIFADKKAVNSAVALNGTSFMSRILKIARKSDTSTTPAKPLHSSSLDVVLPLENPSYAKKAPFVKRQYITSHLQWKRENGNDSLSGPAAGSNISSAPDPSMELSSA